ncbi:DUF2441 domain-containing protein [Cupriavidus taiwanensis]
MRDGVTTRDIIMSYTIMLRESVFENIRLTKFPTRPSRARCIWLCESEAQAEYWFNRLPHTGTKRLLEIETYSGSIHKAFEQHLTNVPENIAELERRAVEYWSGSGSGICEILFTGIISVSREIKISQRPDG